MKPECINAVQTAIGRQITQVEARAIERKVNDAHKRLALKDPRTWAALPRADRLRLAAKAAAEDMLHEAELLQRRAALTVEAHMKHVPDVERAGEKAFSVIHRKLKQADAYVTGVRQEYTSRLLDAIQYATQHDTGSMVARGVRWISNLQNPQKSLAFIREVFGVDTGDAGAKAAGKAWLEGIESMRVRFNEAGGDVRKLIYGYLPQPHDPARIRDVGIVPWVRDVVPMLDRRRYIDEQGRPMTDTEVGEMLEESFRTIVSEGWIKIEPGQFRGEGSLANAGSQARVLHFKDADAYVAYLGKYGQGTVFDALMGHVSWMSRNIGLTEEFGPNPGATYRTLHDIAKQQGSTDRVGLISTTDTMWKTLTGELDRPHSSTWATVGEVGRNVQVFGKLQQTVLTSVTDIPTYMATMVYNRLPMLNSVVNLVQGFGPESRRFADGAGLMADSIITDMRQHAGDRIASRATGVLANATAKASLLEAWTNAVRRAAGIGLMAGLGKLSRTPWEALEKVDRDRLTQQGFSGDEWRVLQAATPERWRNTDMLTPEAIGQAPGFDSLTKQRVVSRMLGVITDESQFGSLAPDLTARTIMSGGLQRGTGAGELWRWGMVFKGFPITMMTRHWSRMFNGEMTPASRTAYAGAMLVGLPLFGALAIQMKELVAGRDPRDMTGDEGNDPARAVKFWTAAFSQGGGAGFLGDMLLTGAGRGGQSGASAAIGGVVGPVYGSGFELAYDVILENLREAAQGKETHAGAEAFRWARGHMPFVNLWYSKLALDQAALNDMQEMLSPGYLARVQARGEREWGSTWWWAPEASGVLTDQGMTSPERAPDLSTAIGAQ